jgi:hypothetical protein
MKDRFKTGSDRQRMHRFGSEGIDGGMPREFQRPWQPLLSKAALRAMAAEAFANTAKLNMRRLQPANAKRAKL